MPIYLISIIHIKCEIVNIRPKNKNNFYKEIKKVLTNKKNGGIITPIK